MNKILKEARLVCVLLFLAILVTGCGGNNKQGSVKEVAKENENSGKTEVIFWSVDWGGQVSNLFKKIVEEFNNQSKDTFVKIQFQIPSLTGGITGFDDKLQPAIIAGTGPDVVTTAIVHEGIDKELFQYVDDYVKDDNSFSWDNYYPFEITKITHRGKKAALPFMVDVCGVMMYNKTMFAKEGLDPNSPPQTLQKLDEIAERLTKRDESGNYVQVGLMPWEWMFEHQSLTLAAIFGAKLVDENGTPTPLDPNLIKAYEWVMSYVRKYGYEQLLGAVGSSGGFTRGVLGMTYAYNGDIFVLYNQDVSFQWGLAPFPTYEEGQDPTWVGGWMLAMVNGSKKQEAAAQFLKYICGFEGQKIYHSLIEKGVGYSFSPMPSVNEYYYDKMNWPQQFFVRNALPMVSSNPQFHIREEISKKYREARKDIFSGKSELMATMESLDSFFKTQSNNK